MKQKQIFSPVETWMAYGLSDLYFAGRNQENDVFRYGTFFYIMAAEKHLKAVLIYKEKSKYENLNSIEEQKHKVEKIVKGYSHNFNQMLDAVGEIYEQDQGEKLVPEKYLNFDTELLVTAMYEGYMETRYPSVFSVSRHFPAVRSKGVYHSPIGSSFFTDFIEMICVKCWKYLEQSGLDTKKIISKIDLQFSKNNSYSYFQNVYLSNL